ncbi:MAG: hypothetical protein H7836_08145 [Magnetococcus sp. YQC-3]
MTNFKELITNLKIVIKTAKYNNKSFQLDNNTTLIISNPTGYPYIYLTFSQSKIYLNNKEIENYLKDKKLLDTAKIKIEEYIIGNM